MNYRKDYYKILGLTEDTDKTEIKKAYKKLARKYHPDINKSKNAEKKFKQINEAYNILSDDTKRRKYDLYRLKLQEIKTGALTKKKTSMRKSKKRRHYRRENKSNISKYVDLAVHLEKDYGLISGLIGLTGKMSGNSGNSPVKSVLSTLLNSSSSGKGKHRHRYGRKSF